MSEEVASREELLAIISQSYERTEIIEEIEKILEELLRNNPSIEVAMVATIEGLPVASYPKTEKIQKEEGILAAAITVIFSTSERSALDLKQGHVDHVIIYTDVGYVVLRLTGEDHILAVLTKEDAKLGVILRDLKLTADKLQKIMSIRASS
ncbi:MAG: roadblock/LC7 domain-containing protein [Candidatus Njordarchaeales archaeon]